MLKLILLRLLVREVNNMNFIDSIIDKISEKEELIDSLSDAQIDYLINYLQVKIKEKENILKELKENYNN